MENKYYLSKSGVIQLLTKLSSIIKERINYKFDDGLDIDEDKSIKIKLDQTSSKVNVNENQVDVLTVTKSGLKVQNIQEAIDFKVAKEYDRALSAEAKLHSNQTAEENRAKEAEKELQGNIDAVSNLLQSGEEGTILTSTEEGPKWTNNLENKLQSEIDTKANIVDLSNILGEEVLDSLPIEDIESPTREDLKKDLFVDLWNNACGSYGKYNVETGYFELNGLTDITYDEALSIYRAGSINQTNCSYQYSNLKIRTNLPCVTLYPNAASSAISETIGENILENSNVQILNVTLPKEVISISAGTSSSGVKLISSDKLIKIMGRLSLSKIDDSASNKNRLFGPCNNLEEVYMYLLRFTVNLSTLPKLGYVSIKYLVDNVHPSLAKNPTVVVSLEHYQALTGNATYPFNGGTQQEWTQLLQDATEKQVTFATV